jgi:HAD superfamily hydrolase (TIGR01509 family)
VILKPAGLLFDMDGVLVDSQESWYQLLACLFRERFTRVLSREEFMSRYWARDLRDIFAELGLAIELDTFCREIYSRYLDDVLLPAGVKETLERLSLFPKAVITNTPAVCAWQILRKFGLQHHFEAVLTGSEVINGKPDPEIVIKGCKALFIQPEEAVLIGDSFLDVLAGRAAGCMVIGIGIEADYTIRRLPELLDLIKT